MVDYFKILDVDYQCEVSDIKRSFREKVKLLHPDTGQYDEKKFASLLEAYHILIDEPSRKEYYHRLILKKVKKSLDSYVQIPNQRIIFPNRLDSILKKIQIFDKKRYRKINKSFKEDLYLILSESEAKKGVKFSVPLPIRVVCPSCAGNDRTCSLCDGIGRITSSHQYEFKVIPPVKNNEIRIFPINTKPFKGAHYVTRKLKIGFYLFNEDDYQRTQMVISHLKR